MKRFIRLCMGLGIMTIVVFSGTVACLATEELFVASPTFVLKYNPGEVSSHYIGGWSPESWEGNITGIDIGDVASSNPGPEVVLSFADHVSIYRSDGMRWGTFYPDLMILGGSITEVAVGNVRSGDWAGNEIIVGSSTSSKFSVYSDVDRGLVRLGTFTTHVASQPLSGLAVGDYYYGGGYPNNLNEIVTCGSGGGIAIYTFEGLFNPGGYNGYLGATYGDSRWSPAKDVVVGDVLSTPEDEAVIVGATGFAMYNLNTYQGGQLGYESNQTAVVIGDVQGDIAPEIIIADGTTGSGAIRVFQPTTVRYLYGWTDSAPGHTPIIGMALMPPPPPDTDGDGVIDAIDNCLAVANADQADCDRDGKGNICDTVDNNLAIVCPDDVIVEAGAGCQAVVTLSEPIVTASCNYTVSNNNILAAFPLGTTTVIWTATSVLGNSVTCNQGITVVDTTPPDVFINYDNKDIDLWPPDHRWVNIPISVIDECQIAKVSVKVTNSEAEAGITVGAGGPQHNPDVIIADDNSYVLVRAERSGTNKLGRIYTITVDATDNSGNEAIQQSIKATVGHDRRSN